MRIITPQRHEGQTSHFKRILVPLSALFGLALFIALFYGLLAGKRWDLQSLNVYCDSNGNVHMEYPDFGPVQAVRNTYWNLSYFLGITMGFGHFSFSTARVIDGLWDIVVGRCGQAGLALLACPVLRRSLNLEMEQSTASLPLFASLAFDKFSATSTWKILHDIFAAQRPAEEQQKDTIARGPRRKRQVWRYIGWASVLTYWLAYPTMTSITTGYQPHYEPYLSPPDSDSLIPMAGFVIPPVVLFSPQNISRTEPIALNSSSTDPEMRTLWQCKSIVLNDSKSLVSDLTSADYEACFLPSHGLRYGPLKETYPQFKSCPDGTCNCTISVNTARSDLYSSSSNTPVTVLDITSSNLTLNSRTFSFDGGLYFTHQCGSGESIAGGCLDSGSALLTNGDYTLDQHFMQDHGFCRPLNQYKWGFSSLALLTHLLITLLVAGILTTLHFDAFCKGKSDRQELDNNVYSDAVIVSRELERLPMDRPLEDVTASELNGVVQAKKASVCIENDDLERPRGSLWQFRRRKETTRSEQETCKEDLL